MSAPRYPMSPAASKPETSRGRFYPEPGAPTRSPFQRDRDRIVHAAAFRRLKHKTQVFVAHEGDYYRTRLTHSLEVAQIARSVSRVLALDEDLAEAIALAHDLGHSPFGHAGEAALSRAMTAFGGFSHNAQSLRVVTVLEEKYAEFDGLNLTWETLEGLAKHNGPLLREGAGPSSLPWQIADYCQRHDLWLTSQPGLEAQIAAIADDIAYHSHDIDDGLRAELFELGDLRAVPLVGPVLAHVQERYPDVGSNRQIHETLRRLISVMVDDLLAETRRRLDLLAPENADAVRAAPGPMAGFSPAVAEQSETLRQFLWEHMYRHHKVTRTMSSARRILSALFERYHAEPDILPTEWRRRAGEPSDAKTARTVSDFIAGMTDRFALEEYRRLTDFEHGI